MKTSVFSLPNEEATRRFGCNLAVLLRPGDIVCLAGPLGAGKSTLARAIIQSLAGHPLDVPSPTFTLVETYDTPAGMVWHFDLYRLEEASEIDELAIDEAMATGICLIEWAERIADLLPPDCLVLSFTLADHNTAMAPRQLTLTGGEHWHARLSKIGLGKEASKEESDRLGR